MPTKAHMRTHRALQIHLVADLPFAYATPLSPGPFTKHETHAPKSVRSSVSFASHTWNHPPRCSASNAVTVRHAPFTAIESPTWQSPRIGAAPAIVSVHPPASRASAETVPRCSICRGARARGQRRRGCRDGGHTRPVNMLLRGCGRDAYAFEEVRGEVRGRLGSGFPPDGKHGVSAPDARIGRRSPRQEPHTSFPSTENFEYKSSRTTSRKVQKMVSSLGVS